PTRAHVLGTVKRKRKILLSPFDRSSKLPLLHAICRQPEVGSPRGIFFLDLCSGGSMRGSPRVIGICLGVCVSCVVMLGVNGDLAFAQAGDGFVAVDVAVSGPHVYSVGLVGADPRLIMLDAMGDGTFSVPR